MLPHVFDGLHQYWKTDKFKVMSEQAKMARGSLKGGSLHTGGAKSVRTIIREMEKEMGRTPLVPKVFKKTHVKKKENESNSDVVCITSLKGIGSSCQAKAIDGVQIVAILAQIEKLTPALNESEQK
ncbi:hypothetical protein MTR67_026006 [Solanum verrucosum]|uniref:Uncharacterized protein n=1 Tax=Solanum verrucosum TaxID=315347 RepID=A0AAF0R680_SOLVR|nr:hypothetical protein MTR67_026006 [Solanum verrucosum]